MEFLNPYWNTLTRVEMLQRWILVHSYLYYELDQPIISDSMYDSNSVQLLGYMVKLTKKDLSNSRYFEAFNNYDGSSGFDLTSKLDTMLLELVKRDAYNLLSRKGE